MVRASDFGEYLHAEDVSNGEKRVDIRALKALVFGRFPKNTAIYEVMLTEKDSLGVFELMVKVDVWLKLLRSVSY
jgi:hypothetical protein